ncbi:hypothetical protein LAZ67_15000980 [Cordylochernes scorpioides]|uniref:Mos1 transposase HTH domain-containing protein n=1 Tax=Cordylochernes scorpioides TaxID=51811 RepID=A0ABY6L8E7_9ARAC|nr:hypothetical protein LAZ67_15000980 [Cordylochernes scorpioides]
MELPLVNVSTCELRTVIRFFTAKNETAVNIHRNLVSVYGEGCMSIQIFRRWRSWFLEGRQNVHDDERSGRPVTATENAAVAAVRNVVEVDRRVTIDEIMINIFEVALFWIRVFNFFSLKYGNTFVFDCAFTYFHFASFQFASCFLERNPDAKREVKNIEKRQVHIPHNIRELQEMFAREEKRLIETEETNEEIMVFAVRKEYFGCLVSFLLATDYGVYWTNQLLKSYIIELLPDLKEARPRVYIAPAHCPYILTFQKNKQGELNVKVHPSFKKKRVAEMPPESDDCLDKNSSLSKPSI